MARLYLFADEAGDFAFKRGPNISRYFIVCSIALPSCDIGDRLLELRRELVWERRKLGDFFHATTDTQFVRDRVFALIAAQDFRVDATIMEKSKAQPQVRTTKDRFYKIGWHYHFKDISRFLIGPSTELMVTAASIATKREQVVFTEAVTDVVFQSTAAIPWRTSFWSAQTDPCLQIADYCTWAIQRKWERGDTRSYDLIKPKIRREFDLWRNGTQHYY